MAEAQALDAPKRAARTMLPLAVDLDGTLMRGDLFTEAMLRFVFTRPWNVLILIAWLLRGRAFAKAKLAHAAPFDPAELPYDQRVIDWLKAERAAGRTIALATASDRSAAQIVADHVGLFDTVYASDGVTNLKSAKKAERLAAAYPQGFVYAGNETADLKVWETASRAVIANAPRWLSAKAHRTFEVEKSFASETNRLRALIKAMRPGQWAKNLLVFVPLLAGRGWFETDAWIGAFLAFAAICCGASSVYLVNDAADIDADRRHPRKHARPFASGTLSPALGIGVAILLAAVGLSLGAVAGVAPLIALYITISSLYSFWLKRAAMVDVFVLGALYAMRVVLGGVATGYFASFWLLAFSCFFFLSIALVKRVGELQTLPIASTQQLSRRGYVGADRSMLTMMGVGASFAAAVVLALYIQGVSHENYRAPVLLWLLPAMSVYWSCRLWLLAHRGAVSDDPLVFAFRDRTSWIVVAVAAAAFLGAVTIPI